MRNLPKEVRVVEVGPRDGLQNEPQSIPTEVKLAYIRKLIDAGFPEIEITAFVRPDRVPRLADAEEVAVAFRDEGRCVLTALVPNVRGLERALKCGVRRIAVFTAASDTFTQRNIGMDVRTSLETIGEVMEQAKAAQVSVRGYVSTAFGCPYEGRISPEKVGDVTESLLQLGVDEVSLGDTIGVAVPTDVVRLLRHLRRNLPLERLALHLHDTSGTALANVLAGLESGITTFDSSAGGLGGCPFAPGAAGNLATEDLVYMLDRMGVRTGIDLGRIADASEYLAPMLGHPLPSKQLQRLRASGC